MEFSADTSFSDPSHCISPQALAACIGHADAPLLLDVRGHNRPLQSPCILAGALRCAPENVAAFMGSQPLRALLAYCVCGHGVSSDAVTTPAGLLAFPLGLSQLHASDDHAMPKAAMPRYDALYAWCQEKVPGQDKPHNWTPATLREAAQ